MTIHMIVYKAILVVFCFKLNMQTNSVLEHPIRHYWTISISKLPSPPSFFRNFNLSQATHGIHLLSLLVSHQTYDMLMSHIKDVISSTTWIKFLKHDVEKSCIGISTWLQLFSSWFLYRLELDIGYSKLMFNLLL